MTRFDKSGFLTRHENSLHALASARADLARAERLAAASSSVIPFRPSGTLSAHSWTVVARREDAAKSFAEMLPGILSRGPWKEGRFSSGDLLWLKKPLLDHIEQYRLIAAGAPRGRATWQNSVIVSQPYLDDETLTKEIARWNAAPGRSFVLALPSEWGWHAPDIAASKLVLFYGRDWSTPPRTI